MRDSFDEILRELGPEKGYQISDFLSEFKHLMIKSDSGVTVSDHLRMKSKERILLRESKFSQLMGVCLFLSELDFIFPRMRLEYYQRIATIEAIQASIRISNRLKDDSKYRKDVVHLFTYFISEKPRTFQRKNRRPTRHRGYRDKGTLPDLNQKAYNSAQKEAYLNILSLPEETKEFLKEFLPEELFEGDELDLPETLLFLKEEEEILRKLKNLLRALG